MLSLQGKSVLDHVPFYVSRQLYFQEQVERRDALSFTPLTGATLRHGTEDKGHTNWTQGGPRYPGFVPFWTGGGVRYAFFLNTALCHHGFVKAPRTTFNGRAYGMDIRVEREDDGTFSVYEAAPFSGLYRFVKRGLAREIIEHYDVSGSMQKFFEKLTP